MVKKLYLCAAALLLILLVFGCTQNSTQTTDNNTAGRLGIVTVDHNNGGKPVVNVNQDQAAALYTAFTGSLNEVSEYSATYKGVAGMYVAIYDINGRTLDSNLAKIFKLVQYVKGDNLRQDFNFGGKLVSFFYTPTGSVLCRDGNCIKTKTSLNMLSPTALKKDLTTLSGKLASAPTTTYSGTLTGQNGAASCFVVSNLTTGIGTYCFSKSGIPLFAGAAGLYGGIAVTATDFQLTVSDSVFTPPYPVQ